jgi:hypothetical protein
VTALELEAAVQKFKLCQEVSGTWSSNEVGVPEWTVTVPGRVIITASGIMMMTRILRLRVGVQAHDELVRPGDSDSDSPESGINLK